MSSFYPWDYHYWLHRGALELEVGNLGIAENFLLQSKSIEPNDIFIDNELAYLNLRKANESPLSTTSEDLVRDAIRTLNRRCCTSTRSACTRVPYNGFSRSDMVAAGENESDRKARLFR